jgi:hypothetical protein
MADPQKSTPEASRSDENEPVSPPDPKYDYSTEKQLDDRVHTVSPLDSKSQTQEVGSEKHQLTKEASAASPTSTAYPNEKKEDLSKTDGIQISTEKQHLAPTDEETSPKYAIPAPDQPGLEPINNVTANDPEPFAGCRTIEPEGNSPIAPQGNDDGEWHTSFWNFFSPASLCMSFPQSANAHEYSSRLCLIKVSRHSHALAYSQVE